MMFDTHFVLYKFTINLNIITVKEWPRSNKSIKIRTYPDKLWRGW